MFPPLGFSFTLRHNDLQMNQYDEFPRQILWGVFLLADGWRTATQKARARNVNGAGGRLTAPGPITALKKPQWPDCIFFSLHPTLNAERL